MIKETQKRERKDLLKLKSFPEISFLDKDFKLFWE